MKDKIKKYIWYIIGAIVAVIVLAGVTHNYNKARAEGAPQTCELLVDKAAAENAKGWNVQVLVGPQADAALAPLIEKIGPPPWPVSAVAMADPKIVVERGYQLITLIFAGDDGCIVGSATVPVQFAKIMLQAGLGQGA